MTLTGLGLLAGLLAAGCTSPSPARQQPAAYPRSPAAVRIAVPAAAGGVDVGAENARAGYRGWRITSPGQLHEIEGYADHASAVPGTAVRLFVSTTAAWFRVRALRFGWYGGAVVFFLATAYVLGREYFELAAMRLRPRAEAKAMRRRNAALVYVGGLFIAAFVSIPVVNLATPLFAMAFMVHLHKRLSRKPL